MAAVPTPAVPRRAPLASCDRRRRAVGAYYRFVDEILPVFGVGPVIDLGGAEHAVTDAFRWRGVEASAVDVFNEPDRLTSLAPEPRSFEAAVVLHVLEHLSEGEIDDAIRELGRVTRRAVFVRVSTSAAPGAAPATIRPRAWWEARFFEAGFGIHPLAQRLTSYDALEAEGPDVLMVFDRLPASGAARHPAGTLPAARLAHLDGLRSSGRRAEARVARYRLAAEFVRPRDRVLDAACGPGDGAAILADGTRADRVEAWEASAPVAEYGRALFAVSRPRVSLTHDQAMAIAERPDGSADVVVAIDALQGLTDPSAFVQEAARVLTPGGRFVCSVPNRWVDDTGRDPNPYHLHVFDLPAILGLVDGRFHVERVFAQTAGGGLKNPDAPRSLVAVDPRATTADPEWWIVVAMKTPFDRGGATFRQPESAHPEASSWTITAVERDYDNPWLVRALVTRGYRARSADLLARFAAAVAASARAGSADRGAALCVQAYAAVSGDGPVAPGLEDALEAYCAAPAESAHAERWRISNEYVLARLRLQEGDVRRAEETFARCARRDCLVFGPLLATKTVDAAFWAGWLAFQRGDREAARRRWAHGVRAAQAAVREPWREVIGSLEEPLLFGLRELTQVLDLASRCASGLHALARHEDRPGLVAEAVFAGLTDAVVARDQQLAARSEALDDVSAELRAVRAEIAVRDAAIADRDRALASRDEALASRDAEIAARDTEVARLQRACDAAETATCELRQLVGRLTDARGVAVFGAGEGGRRFAARWTGAGGRVACFADNRAALWGTRLHGVPVIAPDALPDAGVGLIVIASVAHGAIAAQLAGMRLPAGIDVANGAVFTVG